MLYMLCLILFMVVAIILLLGMIGDQREDNRRNYTYAFCVVVAAIVLIIFK